MWLMPADVKRPEPHRLKSSASALSLRESDRGAGPTRGRTIVIVQSDRRWSAELLRRGVQGLLIRMCKRCAV